MEQARGELIKGPDICCGCWMFTPAVEGASVFHYESRSQHDRNKTSVESLLYKT